ncbi:U3 snoRNP protein [Microsporum ferrugineum]
MASSDKARFYLEQLVSELREFEKKMIFTKAYYARYAEYEMNLDTLRKKRIKRLGVKAPMHTGQRRVFFILDRATRKFHGDVGLWQQYIEYARKQKAYKKLAQIFTNALRLHPREVDLWIYAAQHSLQDHGDITQARGYMQRGLRFCKSSQELWLQYAKLEMIYIARISARQRILGLDKADEEQPAVDNSKDDPDADMMMLPRLTEEDINPTLEGDVPDKASLETLNATPALSGAIPIAVFDAAMGQFENDAGLAYDFYNMLAEFEECPCLRRVLGHVVDSLITSHPTNAKAQECDIKYPVAGISPCSPEFPRAFHTSLSRLREHMRDENPILAQLAPQVAAWLQGLMETENLDPALQKVMQVTLKSANRRVESCRT